MPAETCPVEASPNQTREPEHPVRDQCRKVARKTLLVVTAPLWVPVTYLTVWSIYCGTAFHK